MDGDPADVVTSALDFTDVDTGAPGETEITSGAAQVDRRGDGLGPRRERGEGTIAGVFDDGAVVALDCALQGGFVAIAQDQQPGGRDAPLAGVVNTVDHTAIYPLYIGNGKDHDCHNAAQFELDLFNRLVCEFLEQDNAAALAE